MAFTDKIKNLFNEPAKTNTQTEIKCVGLCNSALAEVMTANLYTRIIHKCFNRTIVPAGVEISAFNRTVYNSYSPYKLGLASIIVTALVDCKKIYVKISQTDTGVKLFTILDSQASEAEQSASDVLELDFTNFKQVKVISLLYCLIQGVMTSIDKGITISQAAIYKIHKLSEMIQNGGTTKVLDEQLTQLNDAISQGNEGYMDALSKVEFSTYDATPGKESLNLIYGMIANVTGLPMSFINSETVSGLGSTEGADNQRLNDAIEYYYYNIVNNILYTIYNKIFEFKQYVSDLNSLVTMFTFIETTTLLTPDGKRKFMRNNTGFSDEDINIEDSQASANTVTNSNQDITDNGNTGEEVEE